MGAARSRGEQSASACPGQRNAAAPAARLALARRPVASACLPARKAQVLLTREPLPQQVHFQNAAAAYAAAAGGDAAPSWLCAAGAEGGAPQPAADTAAAASGQPSPAPGGPVPASSASSGCESDGASPGDDLYTDLLRAHRALGLLRQVTLLDAAGESGESPAAGGRGPTSSSSSSSSLSSSADELDGGGGRGSGGWDPGSAWAFVSLGGSGLVLSGGSLGRAARLDAQAHTRIAARGLRPPRPPCPPVLRPTAGRSPDQSPAP